jgi:hypothetical protein
MKRIILIFAICFALMFSANIYSQTSFETEVSAVGINAATFLEIGVGARAMAMGGSYVAVANDPTALYYNPSGIVWMKGIQVEVMHNEWFVDSDYDFIGLVVPLPFLDSSIGLSVITLGYGEQAVRTVDRPEGTGQTYDARDYAIALTWAKALTDRFSFGMSGKFINQRIWNESGNAAAVDFGIFYHTGIKGLRIGFNMSNFGTTIRIKGRDLHSTIDPDDQNQNVDRVPVEYRTSSYPLPLIFRAGMSYERRLGTFGSALITMDVNHPSHAPESINVGAEFGFGSMFFIRGGYENLFEKNAINVPTIGGGVDYYRTGTMGFRIDYAYSDWGILDHSHRFSVGIIFPN